MKKLLKYGVCFCLIALSGCGLLEELVEDETPTKSKMEGVWEVVEAYDEEGNSILEDIEFGGIYFSLQSDNSVISTAGPMMMYIVYGGSKYTEIASKIDQVFNYTGADFTTNGEWFIDGGVVEEFAIEMKLEGIPGQKTFTELLSLFGIGNDYLDLTIYHRFKNVKVSFERGNNEMVFSSDENDEIMSWEFDYYTDADYNVKDQYGDKILWNGWDATKFSKCTFVFQKRVGDIKDLIKESAKSN